MDDILIALAGGAIGAVLAGWHGPPCELPRFPATFSGMTSSCACWKMTWSSNRTAALDAAEAVPDDWLDRETEARSWRPPSNSS